jgi:carbamoyl-phosphate synthase large subunit
MGIDRTVGLAFAKSQMAAGDRLPDGGAVFLSLADRDKSAGLVAAGRFAAIGFTIAATAGTAAYLEERGVTVDTIVGKVGGAGDEPTALDLLAAGKVDLVVNTPRGLGPRADGQHIRAAAALHNVPCITTVAAALAAANGMTEWSGHTLGVRSIQEWHADGQGEQLGLDL